MCRICSLTRTNVSVMMSKWSEFGDSLLLNRLTGIFRQAMLKEGCYWEIHATSKKMSSVFVLEVRFGYGIACSTGDCHHLWQIYHEKSNGIFLFLKMFAWQQNRSLPLYLLFHSHDYLFMVGKICCIALITRVPAVSARYHKNLNLLIPIPRKGKWVNGHGWDQLHERENGLIGELGTDRLKVITGRRIVTREKWKRYREGSKRVNLFE